jgi:hypothetical protein
MLENFPLSGLALCYGPLALTILLFIFYATQTDAHARRTYFRRLDPRPESERPEDTPITITQPVTGETPAGMRVTLLPPEKPASAAVYETSPSSD